MLILLDTVTATGIIFALGHFYFALVYDAKKYGITSASRLMCASLVVTAGWYFVLYDISSPTRVSIFAVSVLFVFILHNFFDLWRFGYRNAAIIATVIGFILLHLFFWYRSGALNGIIASLGIWLLVFSHYIFWIFITVNRHDSVNSAKFLRETIIVHATIAVGYLVSVAISTESANVAYSLPFFFYPTTLIHVVYSTLRQYSRLSGEKRLLPEAAM